MKDVFLNGAPTLYSLCIHAGHKVSGYTRTANGEVVKFDGKKTPVRQVKQFLRDNYTFYYLGRIVPI